MAVTTTLHSTLKLQSSDDVSSLSADPLVTNLVNQDQKNDGASFITTLHTKESYLQSNCEVPLKIWAEKTKLFALKPHTDNRIYDDGFQIGD